VVGQLLKLAGLPQAIRLRFPVVLKIRERVGCQTNNLFDAETLGQSAVANNRVFPRFAPQECPMTRWGKHSNLDLGLLPTFYKIFHWFDEFGFPFREGT